MRIRVLTLLLGFCTPYVAYAQVHLSDYGVDCPPFMQCDGNVVDSLSGRLIVIAEAFVIALAIVVFFYGAFRMVISRGEEGKEAGKKALLYASVGLVFAVLATNVIDYVWDYLYTLESI